MLQPPVWLWFRHDEPRESRATGRGGELRGVGAVRSRVRVWHDTCPTVPRRGTAIANAATDERTDGRLIVVHQPGAPGRARVSGSLTSDGIRIVLDAIASGVAILDLSDVDRVDDCAVRALADLSLERCTLEACPRWLALWLERVRGGAADDND